MCAAPQSPLPWELSPALIINNFSLIFEKTIFHENNRPVSEMRLNFSSTRENFHPFS
jgi:hypothetical protein